MENVSGETNHKRDIYHTHLQDSWTITEEGVKIWKSQWLGGYGTKQCFLYMTEKLHAWTKHLWLSVQDMHKIKPKKNREALDSWWLLGKTISLNQKCSSWDEDHISALVGILTSRSIWTAEIGFSGFKCEKIWGPIWKKLGSSHVNMIKIHR